MGGMNISQMFQSGIANMSIKGSELQTKMAGMKSGEMKQEDLMQMQFEMGQYNAMTELLSNVTKSMTDMLKTLAQRTS